MLCAAPGGWKEPVSKIRTILRARHGYDVLAHEDKTY